MRNFRDSFYAVSLSVTGKYPKFVKIPHAWNHGNLQLLGFLQTPLKLSLGLK